MILQCGFDFSVSLLLNNTLATINFLKKLLSHVPILYGIFSLKEIISHRAHTHKQKTRLTVTLNLFKFPYVKSI